MFALRLLASWLLAVLLIFIYVNATVHPLPDPPEGFVKLFDRPGENVIFQTMASKTGIALLEPTGRVVVAGLELVIALLILIPGTRRTGAVLSVILMACAVAAHLTPGILGRELPVSMEPGTTQTDYGRVFALAVSMLALSVLLFFVHPRPRRARGQQGR